MCVWTLLRRKKKSKKSLFVVVDISLFVVSIYNIPSLERDVNDVNGTTRTIGRRERERERALLFLRTRTYIVGGGRGQKRREHHEAAEKTASSSKKKKKSSSKSASHQIGVGRDDDVRDSFSPKKRLRVERFWRRRDRLDETGSPKSDEQNDDDDHSPEERRRTEGKKRTKRGARR